MRPRTCPVKARMLLLGFLVGCASPKAQGQDPVRDFDLDKVRYGDHYAYFVTEGIPTFEFQLRQQHKTDGRQEKPPYCYREGCVIEDCQLPHRSGYLFATYHALRKRDTGDSVWEVVTVKVGVYDSDESLSNELEWSFYQPHFVQEWAHTGRHELTKVNGQFVFDYLKPKRERLIAWTSRNFVVVIEELTNAKLEDRAPLIKAYLKKYPSSLSPERISKNYREYATGRIGRYKKDLSSEDATQRGTALQQIYQATILDVRAFFGEAWLIQLWVDHFGAGEVANFGRLALLMLCGHRFEDQKAAAGWWKENKGRSREVLVRQGLQALVDAIDIDKTFLNLELVFPISRLVGSDFGFKDARGEEPCKEALRKLKAWWRENGDRFHLPEYGAEVKKSGNPKRE